MITGSSLARRQSWLLAPCLLALLSLPCCRPAVRGNGLNVLLVTLETTRADHLGAYGYHRATTPNLDRLAARGVLFENMLAVSPRTNPSLASLLTSVYPQEHGVRNLMLPLEPENRTLAEILRDSGYETAAVQTHPRLIASSGFAQGFSDYADDFATYPLAHQACGVATDWIRRSAAGERPWFMWLHLMDPHWTYDPPAGWRTPFGPDDSRPTALYRELAERRRTIGPVIFENRMPADEVEAFVDFYDAEIRYTDAAIGRMLDTVDAMGLLEETLIVVTADHGESLGEHEYFFEHGDFGTEPEIRVPLIVVAPGGVPAGGRVPWTVPNLDVTPTILDLLDLPPETGFSGDSLVPLLERPELGEHRRCFGETGKRFHPENRRREVDGVEGKWRWLRQGRWKLLHIPRGAGRFDRVLYDVVDDPEETRDVSPENPEIVSAMGLDLDAWLAEDTAEPREYHLTREAEEQLRSLGYVN